MRDAWIAAPRAWSSEGLRAWGFEEGEMMAVVEGKRVVRRVVRRGV